MSIRTVDALRTTALQNAGVFAALFSRSPRSITFKGKTYLREAMRSVEHRLWYLSAAAQTQPAALTGIANASFGLDEVYGLDPDRSAVVEAESALRTATAAVGTANAAVNSMKRRITDAESALRDAVAAQKEAQKFAVGDIFTAGISAAARNLYADGQVAMWKDRISALKRGVNVGLAGDGGWVVPTDAGLTQLQGKLAEARAAQRSAASELAAAKASYDAEARTMRAEEERQRRAQAAETASAAQVEAEARQRETEAAARLEATRRASEQPPASSGAGGAGNSSDPTTWEGYSSNGYTDDATGDAVEPDYGDLGDDFDSDGDDLDDARFLYPDDEARAWDYAEDVLGVDDSQSVAIAQLSYQSPYSFDGYYGADCDGSCGDEGCDTCDDVAALRGEMLDAGWGLDADTFFSADRLGDPDEQGGSSITGSAAGVRVSNDGGFEPSSPYLSGPGSSNTPFDFAAVIPMILSAVLMLAPLIMQAFGAPTSLEAGSGNLSDRARRDVTPPPMVQAPPDNRLRDTGIAVAVGVGLLKVLS